jgi:hypothetical protein
MRSCRSLPGDDPYLQRHFFPSSVAILTLSYVAQALVVVVVGLNLGFRYDMSSLHSTENLCPVPNVGLMYVHCCCNCRKENLRVWKKVYLSLRKAKSTSVAAAPSWQHQSSNVDENNNKQL